MIYVTFYLNGKETVKYQVKQIITHFKESRLLDGISTYIYTQNIYSIQHSQ